MEATGGGMGPAPAGAPSPPPSRFDSGPRHHRDTIMDDARPSAVTLMDAQGIVLAVVSIEEFRRSHDSARRCRRHALQVCALCRSAIPERARPMAPSAEVRERARRAAMTRWHGP